jgi:hypothetical protein
VSNPFGVVVGQVWEDCDPRLNGVRFIVLVVGDGYANCRNLGRQGSVSGRRRTIRLDRFKRTARGYRRVS